MTVLGLHQRLQLTLLQRASGNCHYRLLLERALRCPLERILISTAEHTAPFNRSSTMSFLLPQLTLQHVGMAPTATLVILAGSLIPMDNAHYPRGFYFPNRERAGRRFNLVPQA